MFKSIGYCRNSFSPGSHSFVQIYEKKLELFLLRDVSNFNYRWTRCFFVFSFASLYRILFSQSLFLFGKEKKRKKTYQTKSLLLKKSGKMKGTKIYRIMRCHGLKEFREELAVPAKIILLFKKIRMGAFP